MIHHAPTGPAVRVRRWRAVLLLCGWFVATGAHWDVIQVTAWARMWANNARSESPAAALATTFSPEGMCGVCHAVQAAKQARSNDSAAVPGQFLEKAPLLPIAASRFVIAAPRVSPGRIHFTLAVPSMFRSRPPVPPPRGLLS